MVHLLSGSLGEGRAAKAWKASDLRGPGSCGRRAVGLGATVEIRHEGSLTHHMRQMSPRGGRVAARSARPPGARAPPARRGGSWRIPHCPGPDRRRPSASGAGHLEQRSAALTCRRGPCPRGGGGGPVSPAARPERSALVGNRGVVKTNLEQNPASGGGGDVHQQGPLPFPPGSLPVPQFPERGRPGWDPGGVGAGPAPRPATPSGTPGDRDSLQSSCCRVAASFRSSAP